MYAEEHLKEKLETYRKIDENYQSYFNREGGSGIYRCISAGSDPEEKKGAKTRCEGIKAEKVDRGTLSKSVCIRSNSRNHEQPCAIYSE